MSAEFHASVTRTPRVSILMPIRGCRASLPMAVASVLAQTVEDWELLVVQDDDEPELDWLDGLGDRRIRRLASNPPGGRGAARQAGLDAAQGEFLAFLDADDWMLPDRLERQTEVLQREPPLMLIAGGMFIEDRAHELAGIRRGLPDRQCSRVYEGALVRPPVLGAACMVRTDRARDTGYDPSLQWSEDTDFFHRYLLGQRYFSNPEPVYCYREFDSFTPEGFRNAQRVAFRTQRARASRFRDRCSLSIQQALKRLVYGTALRIGASEWILERRIFPAGKAAVHRYREGRQRVEAALRNLERVRCRAA